MSMLLDPASPPEEVERPMVFSHHPHPWVKRWLTALTVMIAGSWAAVTVLFVWMQHEHASLPPSPQMSVDASSAESHATGSAHPHDAARPAQAEAATAPLVASSAEGAHVGPWGRISAVPIELTPPLEFVPELAPPASDEVVWSFNGLSIAAAAELLNTIGLSDAVRSQLIEWLEVDPEAGGTVIRPRKKFVVSLPPEDRAKLYAALAHFPANEDIANAYRHRGDDPAGWLAPAGLSSEVRDLVLPLIYRDDGYLLFSDMRVIQSSLPSGLERIKLIKVLSREQTYLLSIRVGPEDHLEELSAYWSRGGRERYVRPLLEAAVRSGRECEIPVAHLLPTFARLRLYTYPEPPERLPALNRDCHWAAFNFFNDSPDDRFADGPEVVRTLNSDYYRVFGNLQLGDLVMYVIEEQAIHSCVYIADDYVFTKNGNTSAKPYMIMKLDEMKGYYQSSKPLEVRYYRKKNV